MHATAVVELLGAPASGKSGLAAELCQDPAAVLVKDHGRREIPRLLWGATRAWPVLLEAPPDGATRLRWAAWAGRLVAAPAVATRRGSGRGLVVLDQGPAYTLARMADVRRTARGSHWWHRQACATARLLDVLVVLDAEPEVLSRRLHARPKAHRATVLDDRATDDYLRAEQATCRVVADAVARAGAAVLHLDTGRVPVAEQAAAVRSALAAAARRDGVRR